jgi:hypothetical protein
MNKSVHILEKGDIYFFYRPRVQTEKVHSLEDTQKLYLVLKGEKSPYRLIIVGKKKLPSYSENRVEFAFVDAIFEKSQDLITALESKEYETKTEGKKVLPAARPFAEGKYLLFQDTSTCLAYELQNPKLLGKPQKQFALKLQACWIIAIKNPNIASFKGLDPKQKASFPEKLLAKFHGRKFISLDDSDYLNYAGAELLLIDKKYFPEKKKKGVFEEQFASFTHLDIESAFKIKKLSFPTKPLLGDWE